MGIDNLAVVEQKLESDGWHITTDGLNIITQNAEVKDVRSALQFALDTDIKDIGKAVLADMLAQKCIDRAVLQIQKIRNVSAPKANEDSQAAPRMLKLIVTDGHTYCQAVECDSLPKLSLHKTPPGAKVLLTGAKVMSGFVVIDSSTCSYLGGKVPALFDKWELNKNISNCKRGNCEGDGGPPPWVNFGIKISGFEDKANFKSLETKNKDGKPTEFDVQRQDAIAEAANGAIKKFGGGVKSSVQNEPLKYDGPPRNNRMEDSRERNFNRRNKREPRDKPDDKQQKPSEKVSLFAFLEDKLPVNTHTEVAPYHDYNHAQNDYFRNSKPSNPSNKSKPYQFNQGAKEVDKGFVKNERAPRFNAYQKPPRDAREVREVKTAPPVQQGTENITNNFERLNLNASFATKAFKQHLNLPNNARREARDFNGPHSGNKFEDNDFGGPKFKPNDFGGPKYKPSDFGGPRYTKQNAYEGPRPQAYDSGSDYGHSRESTEAIDDNAKSGWQWKVGDHCMAKYWDDNKYYNATITALTSRTCVVQFNDYGNMEEVLYTHCIPITNPNHESHLLEANGKQNDYSGSLEFRRGGNRNYYNKGFNNKPRQDRRN